MFLLHPCLKHFSDRKLARALTEYAFGGFSNANSSSLLLIPSVITSSPLTCHSATHWARNAFPQSKYPLYVLRVLSAFPYASQFFALSIFRSGILNLIGCLSSGTTATPFTEPLPSAFPAFAHGAAALPFAIDVEHWFNVGGGR